MPRGVYDRNPKEKPMAEATVTQPVSAAPVKLFPVVLQKNYVPAGAYEIVGYLKEAVKRKDGKAQHYVSPEGRPATATTAIGGM